MKKAIPAILGGLVFALFMAWTQSMTVRGFVASRMWDGKSTFACAGNYVVTISGKHIDLPNGPQPANGVFMSSIVSEHCQDQAGGCPVLYASGNCQLDIVDSTITAPNVLVATGGAKVTVKNSKLNGNVTRAGGAVISGLPENEADVSKRFGAKACEGAIACYREKGAYGSISGRLVADIGADGRATAAHYENGSAPPEVQSCLVDLGKRRVIAPYDDKPGQLICDFSGNFSASSQSIELNPSFKH